MERMETEIDIRLLQSKFQAATEIHTHRDYNGKIARCCQIAQLTMGSTIIACGLKSGLSGVLDYLQSKFRWGLEQEKFYCRCLNKSSLACGASTAVACWALEYYRDMEFLSTHADQNFSVISVQMIEECSLVNANLWRSVMEKRKDDCSRWICDTCNFHECIGIINKKTRELSVWDFGVWRKLHSSYDTAGALLSIRLDTRCKGNTAKFQEYQEMIHSGVNWDGCEMQFEKWMEVPSEASLCQLSIPAQKNILGDIYSLRPKEMILKNSARPLVYISGVEMG